MPTLLQIDSSPLGGASISRLLTHDFAVKWRQANPAGNVTYRDLAASHLTPITGEWVQAAHTPADARTPAQRQALEVSDTLIAELKAADEYVFGVPMHNFAPPSTFKLWIDQIVRAGETFSYAGGVPSGLLREKKATFLVASGGVYAPGSAMAAFDFVEPYLRTLFGFVGVADTRFIRAGGASVLARGNMDKEIFLKPHLESIRAQLAAA
jgi:FMN-dependent NADH-azoreductase